MQEHQRNSSKHQTAAPVVLLQTSTLTSVHHDVFRPGTSNPMTSFLDIKNRNKFASTSTFEAPDNKVFSPQYGKNMAKN